MIIQIAILIQTFYTIKSLLDSRDKIEEWVKVVMAVYEKQMQIMDSKKDPTILVNAFYKYLLEYADIFDADPSNNKPSLDSILKSSKKILESNSDRYVLSTTYAKVSPFFPTPFRYLDNPKRNINPITAFTATEDDLKELLKKSNKDKNTDRFKELSKDIKSYRELLSKRSTLAQSTISALNPDNTMMTEYLFNTNSNTEYYWGGDKCNVYVGEAIYYALKKVFLTYTNAKYDNLDDLLTDFLLDSNHNLLTSSYYRYLQPSGIFEGYTEPIIGDDGKPKTDDKGKVLERLINTTQIHSKIIFEKCPLNSVIEPGAFVCFITDGYKFGHIEMILSKIDGLQNKKSFVSIGAHPYGVYRKTHSFDSSKMQIVKVKESVIKSVVDIKPVAKEDDKKEAKN